MNLAHADHQYSKIINNPYIEDELVLDMVISGSWCRLYFKVKRERWRNSTKISKPIISIKNNNVIFSFSAVNEYQFVSLNSRYVIGVDVGLTNYATISVVDTIENRIVESSMLSRRVRSLTNSVNATREQVRNLTKQKFGVNDPVLLYRLNSEIKSQRASLSRKKKQLAIIAAQEISRIAYLWDNAVISVEDLSWVSNTMLNGRWNRGELVRWLTHYAEQNGSRVLKVSACNTSQYCHDCENRLVFIDYHTVWCDNCDRVIDRDVNASGMIGLRLARSGVLSKIVSTRESAKKFKPGVRSECYSPVSRDVLKYPGRDRSKSGPTSKQVKKRKNKSRIINNSEGVGSVRVCSPSGVDRIVVGDNKFESESLIGTVMATRLVNDNKLLI